MPTTTAPKAPLPADAVPVVPATRSRSLQKLAATGVVLLGALIQAFVATGPDLVREYPEFKWLGPVTVFVGFLWHAIRQQQDQGSVVATNYSAAPGTPTEATRPMAEAVADKGMTP